MISPPFGRNFLPGPTDVHPEVLAAQAQPMFGHRGRRMREIFSSIQPGLQEAFGTAQPVFIATCSGTGLLEAALHPFDVGRTHPVIVCQDAARPHRGCHLVLRYADPLATKVLRAAGARALVDEDARLPEEARGKNRDRDEVVGAPTAAHYIPAQRELRGVEFAVLSHAPEDFLHAQHDVGQVDALCTDPTVAERVRPIIVSGSQCQAQHAHLRAPVILL